MFDLPTLRSGATVQLPITRRIICTSDRQVSKRMVVDLASLHPPNTSHNRPGYFRLPCVPRHLHECHRPLAAVLTATRLSRVPIETMHRHARPRLDFQTHPGSPRVARAKIMSDPTEIVRDY